MLPLILLVFAFVLAFIAAVVRDPVEPHRLRLIAASMAFFYAALLFGKEALGKYFLPIILIPMALSMSGCVSLKTWWGDHQTQVAATGSLVAKKVAGLALNMVIQAAQSPQDATKKADYFDSLAYGFRTMDRSNIVAASDVADVFAIWAPDKPHWAELGSEVIEVVKNAGGPSDQRLEMVAEGLNIAAAKIRKDDNAP